MSGTNTDTISYFTIYMRHCTVSQPNEDEDKLVIAGAVSWNICHRYSMPIVMSPETVVSEEINRNEFW